MLAEDVTSEWLSSVLGGDVGPIGRQRIGDGHIGVNVRVTMPSAEASLPRSVVVKLPATDDTSLTTAAMLRHYERETRFYTELAGTVDMRVPECLHGDWTAATNAFVLVLEDMAPATQGDQVTGCTLGQAGDAVRELAKLHGPRWDDPTLSDIDWIEHDTGGSGDDVGAGLAMMWQMFFPGFSATYRSHLSAEEFELAERFGSVVATWRGGRTGPKVITHGDYRLDNMLFATSDGGPPVTVVDWQTPAHGSPIQDLSYFIGAGLLPADRRAHERELIAVYLEALEPYGVSLDEAWVWEQYRRDAFAGLVVAAMASQIVTLNDRSEAMFGAMAQRHLCQALDLDSFDLV
ncbi:MAG TPA: phosphotransferase [Ilumatobacteraceae bacterium]|nr:phosphotransferase [Ilumatobacteraceae bacterium]